MASCDEKSKNLVAVPSLETECASWSSVYAGILKT